MKVDFVTEVNVGRMSLLLRLRQASCLHAAYPPFALLLMTTMIRNMPRCIEDEGSLLLQSLSKADSFPLTTQVLCLHVSTKLLILTFLRALWEARAWVH